MIDRIIEELYASKELDDCINKMVREDLRADFKQELFLIICEWPHERTISLYESKQIKYYIVRTIINLVSQTRNIFHKKYGINKNLVNGEYREDFYGDIDNQIESLFHEGHTITPLKHKHTYDDDDPVYKEKLFDLVEKGIKKMDEENNTFYFTALTELLKRHKSMSEAARQTGIPVSTISRGIKKIREYLNSFPDE